MLEFREEVADMNNPALMDELVLSGKQAVFGAVNKGTRTREGKV